MKFNKKYILPIIVGVLITVVVIFSITRSSKSTECPKGQMSGNGWKSVKGSDGEQCQSFLGITAPRGVRNNNVGNIKMGASAWRGKIPNSENTDGTFEQFESFMHGTRAMIYLLDRKYIQKGYNTIRKLVQRWSATDQNAYMNFVSRWTNIDEDTQLVNNKATIKKLVDALSRFENGRAQQSDKPVVTPKQFELAWNYYKTA